MVHATTGVMGEQQIGEAGLWGKILVSLKSMVKFSLALAASLSIRGLCRPADSQAHRWSLSGGTPLPACLQY